MTALATPFYYGSLAPADLAVVRDAEAAINTRFRRTYEEAVEIGHELTRVKDILPHGQFESWITNTFSFTITSARNFMRLAAMPLEPATVAGLPLGVLYQIASPDLSSEQRAEILAPTDDGRLPVEWKVKSRLTHVRRTIREQKAQEAADAKRTSRQRASRKAADKRRELQRIEWQAGLAREQQEREAATVRLVTMLRESFTDDELSEIKRLLALVYTCDIVDRLGAAR